MQKVNAGQKKFAVRGVWAVRIIQLHGRKPPN
jgi:hypothetical protein